MNIRLIQANDAEAFLQVWRQIVGETPFMLRDPDEVTITIEQIKQTFLSGTHLLLIAEQEGQLLGFLMGVRSPLRRTHHTLTIVIGVLQAFTRQHIGTCLFQAMEQWAKCRAITRLELQVGIANQAAIALYTKQGFFIEGIMRHSQLIHGCYFDEYLMAKIME